MSMFSELYKNMEHHGTIKEINWLLDFKPSKCVGRLFLIHAHNHDIRISSLERSYNSLLLQSTPQSQLE